MEWDKILDEFNVTYHYYLIGDEGQWAVMEEYQEEHPHLFWGWDIPNHTVAIFLYSG